MSFATVSDVLNFATEFDCHWLFDEAFSNDALSELLKQRVACRVHNLSTDEIEVVLYYIDTDGEFIHLGLIDNGWAYELLDAYSFARLGESGFDLVDESAEWDYGVKWSEEDGQGYTKYSSFDLAVEGADLSRGDVLVKRSPNSGDLWIPVEQESESE